MKLNIHVFVLWVSLYLHKQEMIKNKIMTNTQGDKYISFNKMGKSDINPTYNQRNLCLSFPG